MTKRGLNRVAARSVHPQVARDRIRAGAEEAIRLLPTMSPCVVTAPVTIETIWATSPQADMVAMLPTAERTGDRTVRWTAADAVTAYRTSIAAYLIARAANSRAR